MLRKKEMPKAVHSDHSEEEKDKGERQAKRKGKLENSSNSTI